jgi:aspartate/methionine/tyrosine aminotransferase
MGWIYSNMQIIDRIILPETMQLSDRLAPLQHNVFADIDRVKAKVQASGLPVIDLSIGSSDLPTSQPILETIAASLQDPTTHGYLLFNGTEGFRQAAALWYERKFGIAVDPETEVLQLVGSQEGTGHLPLAVLNPGDYALLLDPGYPSHVGGVHLAGGQIYPMPITAENGYLPIFQEIPAAILSQARMMVLSYPHNPTSAIATLSFFQEAVQFCQDHDLVLVHDFPYVDLYFGDEPMPSVFQADLNKSCSIELFSLSKSYNMGGFRIGFAIGNPQLIKALRQIKATVDFNQYRGILDAASLALTGPQDMVVQTVETFRERLTLFVKAMGAIGWEIEMPNAAMYIWTKIPDWISEYYDHQSMKFCIDLMESTGVIISPGTGFGAGGEGYVRFAMVCELDVLQMAVDRIEGFLAKLKERRSMS